MCRENRISSRSVPPRFAYLISYLPQENLVGVEMFGSPLSQGEVGRGKLVDSSTITDLRVTFAPHPSPTPQKGREQTEDQLAVQIAFQNDS